MAQPGALTAQRIACSTFIRYRFWCPRAMDGFLGSVGTAAVLPAVAVETGSETITVPC